MDIFSTLKEDHKMVKDLMRRIEKTEDIAERDAMFETLAQEVAAHAEAEEEVFYTPLKMRPGTDKQIVESFKEHEIVADLLAEVRGKSGGPEWEGLFDVLCESLEHHIKEEEGELFPLAKKELTKEEQEEMAEEMTRRKAMIMEKS